MLGLGVGLTALVTGVLGAFWGRDALIPGLSFGAVATAVQVVAVRAIRPVMGGPTQALLRRWVLGMGLRLAGVVLFAAAVLVDRTLFPPLPSAFGYLGVLLPLLFVETKLAQ